MRQRSDRGSVTVYALMAGFMLCLGAVIAAQATALIRLQHEVSAAADLGAVAASAAAVSGADGCAAARNVVELNGASLVGCSMAFEVATVIARDTSGPLWGQRFAVERKARALPADYVADP
ncbi:MAG TPA: Rv3654c family TadE-like protein [Aeromicrobium sp.]|nr:Rv3654c family TadE-like protein [Aeromicrobium sp.]